MADRPVVYREQPRGYASTAALFGLIALGFVADIALGGAGAHWLAWSVAALVVCGIDALTVYAARSARSITVTSDEVAVGSDARVERSQLAARVPVDDARMPVLGRSPGTGLPRGVEGLGVRTVDGTELIIPTRTPVRLAAVLGLAGSRPVVRPATEAELGLLPEIELRSGALFRVAGLDLPDDVLTEDELRAAELVLVVDDPPVGFAMLAVVDGNTHLQQLSVLPGSMRRGLGSALIEASVEHARATGRPAVTLTTFTDVSFNGPFYARRGFVELAEPGPELTAVREAERAAGLDAISPRTAMIRRLDSP